MGDPARILVVCTGNICRSPFIERLLRLRLAEQRDPADWPVVVVSAGTMALTGWGMEERVAAQLVALGADAGGFRSRQLTAALIADADLVLTATRAHRGEVGTLVPSARRRVFALRDFADLIAGADELYAGPPPDDARAWVARVGDVAASLRGVHAPLDRAEADIVDPYGRPDDVVATMTRQVEAVMSVVVRALTAAR